MVNDDPVEAIEFENEIREGKDTKIQREIDIPDKIEDNININDNKKLGSCDRPNNYHFELTSILNLIYHFICLVILLILFIDYTEFTFRPLIPFGFVAGSWIVAGIVFIITKMLQYRVNYEQDLLHIVFTVILYIFLFIQFFGFWSLTTSDGISYAENYGKILVQTYISYYIFGILYYSTIGIFIVKKKSINFLWFLIIGFIYIVITGLAFYLIIKGNDNYESSDFFIGLMYYIFEVVFYNFGIGLAYCRNVLSEYHTSWNILSIKIFQIYPLLILVSIPVIIIALMLACCGLMFGVNFG